MLLRKFVIFLFCLLSPVFAAAQRLPQGVTPEHYSLTFVPDLAKATFSGEETILVQVQKPGSTITLNAADLEFQETTVTQGEKAQTAQVQSVPEKQQATLSLATPLEAGAASVHIRFTGILNDQLRGFYRARSPQRSYAVTQFEPTDARRAFPSFDEPAMKATFDITLVVDNGDTAISNGHILSDDPGPGAGKHTLKFSTTPKMSTYLVAMAVGDFVCNVGAEDNIPIRVCGTPDKKPLGLAALRYAKENLKFFNQYYSTPYPFGKLDIVGVPDFEAGAMENTAAIFYRESDLFIDDGNSSVRAHQNVFEILSHEMAHQWFGDLVTMKWWDNLWLNEGFATWMELKPAQALHPEWNAHLDAVAVTSSALAMDALANTHPIRARADTPDEINALFDPISYAKGGAVLRMLEWYVSPDVFRRGVNAYVKKFANSNATSEDFWRSLAEASMRPVDKIMPTFVEQPGAPLITVKAACVAPPPEPKVRRSKSRRSRTRQIKPAEPKTEIVVEQSRFWDDPSAAPPSSITWMVPLCVKTATAKPFCQIVSQKTQTIPATGCAPWVLANAGASGYYRTRYDGAVMQQLTAVAGSELTPAERVSLLRDEAALVASGQESMARYLDLVTALSTDPLSAVLDSYAPTLDEIHRHLLTGADKPAFLVWVRATFGPVFAQVGWTPSPGENDDRRSLRSDLIQILGQIGEDPEVIRHAVELARQYVKDGRALDPSLAGAVLGVAALSNDAGLFQQFLDAWRNPAVTPEQHENFAAALAQFRDPGLAQRWLQTAITEARNQDAAGYIYGVINNGAVNHAAWEWVKQHWPEVEARLTVSSGGSVVFATGSFCEASDGDDVQKFFSEHKVPSSEGTLKRTLERINRCAKTRERLQSDVATWLQQRQANAPAGNR